MTFRALPPNSKISTGGRLMNNYSGINTVSIEKLQEPNLTRIAETQPGQIIELRKSMWATGYRQSARVYLLDMDNLYLVLSVRGQFIHVLSLGKEIKINPLSGRPAEHDDSGYLLYVQFSEDCHTLTLP